MLKISGAIFIALSIALSGCATVDTLQPNGKGSTFTVTGKSYDEVWKASVRAMSTNLTIVERSKEKGYIKSEKGVGFATWGEVVGIFISPPADSDKYKIEVQSYKRARFQITGQDWTQSVITNIEAELGQ